MKLVNFIKELELENETIVVKSDGGIKKFPAVKGKYFIDNGFDNFDVDHISVEDGILSVYVKVFYVKDVEIRNV